jgi:acyl-homoserine-lactone acylase
MTDEHGSTVDIRLTRRGVLQLGGGLAAGAASMRLTGPEPATAQTATPIASPVGSTLPPPGTAEILWDTWGVPHIFAGDDQSLFYAFGWAETHNHGDAVLRLFGSSRGRAAEYWGESQLDADIFTLTLGVPERAARWYDAQTQDAKLAIDAFTAGINAYAAAHPDQITADLHVVLPVTPIDVLAQMQQGLYITFILSPRMPVIDNWKAGTTVVPSQLPKGGGSNGWVIGPSKSASGNAMLLCNPHLGWTTGVETFWESHLVSPTIEFHGAALLAFPLPVIGFTESGGWTHTVNEHNGVDLFELTLDGDGYRYDGETKPFDTQAVTIKVRQEDGSLRDEPLTIRRSVQGPVVAERDGKALALRFAGLEADRSGAVAQYLAMMRSRDLAEFESALQKMQLPMFTVLYANQDGDIMHFFASFTPKRAFGDWDFWWGVVPGNTSQTLFTDLLNYDESPKVINPGSGWLQNANDPPWTTTIPWAIDPANYAPYVSTDFMELRAQQSAKLLMEVPNLTLEQVISQKFSNHVEMADRLLAPLIAAARAAGGTAGEAAEVLSNWDRTVDAESRGALLFIYWASAMNIAALPVRLGGSLADENDAQQRTAAVMATGLFATPWLREAPLATPIGLADPTAAVAALEQAADKLKADAGNLDAPWGQLARAKVGAYDLPANGGPGDPVGIFNALPLPFGLELIGKGEQDDGDTFVAAVEFSNPVQAHTLVSYGNASQPGSPHIGDQLPLLMKGELRPAWRTRAEIEAHLEGRETLTVSSGAG